MIPIWSEEQRVAHMRRVISLAVPFSALGAALDVLERDKEEGAN